MRSFSRSCVRVIALAAMVCSCLQVVAQTDGIFAEFTTSMGSFTCRLDYVVAPKAVANFIGLATGQCAWLDLTTGQVRTNNFYDGLIFHRVITNFMIQGGSPNRLGTDGPGYVFTDEFSPTARFDSVGVLGMANSGTNSNGSQFFITVAPTPFLNDKHTVFGRLTSGTNVVVAISQVPTNSNSRPLTDVVIQQLRIRRVGTAAQAFDINAQGLPVVTNVTLGIRDLGADVSLTFANCQYAHNQLFVSSNLTQWTEQSLGIELGSPAAGEVRMPKSAPSDFYMAARAIYSGSTLAPYSLERRKLTLTFAAPTWITPINVTFTDASSGTYIYKGIAGTVNYLWSQEPYRGRLQPIFFSGSDLRVMIIRMDFAGTASGGFSGSWAPFYPIEMWYDVRGSFSLQ